MDISLVQAEVDKVRKSTFAKKTDKQLLSYQVLSEIHKQKNKGIQPSCLKVFNQRDRRSCKLTQDQVNEIVKKYNPYVCGKQLLAKQYGVSPNTIYKIVKKHRA